MVAARSSVGLGRFSNSTCNMTAPATAPDAPGNPIPLQTTTLAVQIGWRGAPYVALRRRCSVPCLQLWVRSMCHCVAAGPFLVFNVQLGLQTVYYFDLVPFLFCFNRAHCSRSVRFYLSIFTLVCFHRSQTGVVPVVPPHALSVVVFLRVTLVARVRCMPFSIWFALRLPLFSEFLTWFST
jgi:hypothetical protein